jgi:hypothetical protein
MVGMTLAFVTLKEKEEGGSHRLLGASRGNNEVL